MMVVPGVPGEAAQVARYSRLRMWVAYAGIVARDPAERALTARSVVELADVQGRSLGSKHLRLVRGLGAGAASCGSERT